MPRWLKWEMEDCTASNADSLEGSIPSLGTTNGDGYYEGPGTILGGLPVWAKLHGCYDSFHREYDCEVVSIHWVDKNGKPRGQISQKVYDKAADYDYGFCDLMMQVDESVSYAQWLAKEPERRAKERRKREAFTRRVQRTTRKRTRALTL